MAWFQGDLIGVLSFLSQSCLTVCWAAVIVVYFGQRWEKKLSPKGIDPPKCKCCLNRPEALSEDHEVESIPLQQIWR